MSRILVTIPFSKEQRQSLADMAASYHDELIWEEATNLLEVEGVIGNLPLSRLKEEGENLKWVQLCSSGADTYAKGDLLPHTCILCSATGAYGTGISEYMICMLVSMMKKVPLYLENSRAGIWRDEGSVDTLYGKRVLLVGCGDIGMSFALRLVPFGCEIVGIRRKASLCPEPFLEMHALSELEEEVQKADVIALSLPGTKETYHLFHSDILKRCKEGSYFLNVGRGSTVEDAAFLKAEVASRFAGIWLDVFEKEPLPENDPLFGVPNLYITPHITGGYHLDLTLQNIFNITVHNYRAFHQETAYRSVVDTQLWYVG